MSNKFGIPDVILHKIRSRDKKCVYCHKTMVYPYAGKQRNWATIEHLRETPPFYWVDGKRGLQAKDIVICCGSCNSSRGIRKLTDWFKTPYCIKRKINEKTIATPVKKYLKRRTLRFRK